MFSHRKFTEEGKKSSYMTVFCLDSGDWSLKLSLDLLPFQCTVQKCMRTGSCRSWLGAAPSNASFLWFLISHSHACGLIFFFLSLSIVLTCGPLPDAQRQHRQKDRERVSFSWTFKSFRIAYLSHFAKTPRPLCDQLLKGLHPQTNLL